MFSPRKVMAFSPSMKTGAAGASPVPGQADADVGVLALARAVDDAAHDRDLEFLDARVFVAFQDRHLRAQVVVDLLRQFLEGGAGGAAAAGAGGDARVERAQAQRLQDFGGDHDFLRSRFTRLRL